MAVIRAVAQLQRSGANLSRAEEAALREMETVTVMPIWAEQIQRNPKNKDIMLSHKPDEFITRMDERARGFIPSPDTPIGGIAQSDFARMSMPVHILRGSPRDLYHPAYMCEQVHALLPNAQLMDPPWWLGRFRRAYNGWNRPI